MAGWTHDEAKKHTIVERLHERCATYAGATCDDREIPYFDWCERCLAADALIDKTCPPLRETHDA